MLYAASSMTDKMLKFVKLDQQNPPKRKVLDRKEDFNEIYSEFINEKAKEQSSRCSQCGVPFCQVHCPLSNNIPDWLKLTAEGRLKEAYELAQSTNNMPEVCGRICPQDRLGEGNCVIEQSGHGTVTIGSVEKFITENAWENKWVEPIKVRIEKKQSVGIIGAGPAGLACAEQLRKQGYQVTIYDRYDRAGGLLIYGIPNFKLEQQNPPKREVLERKEDFNEIYREFINEKAKEQSSRCSQCGVPFCQVHCPLSNNIPDWLKLTAEGRLKDAYELAQSTNNMPEVCGRICPQDRLCEGNCVIEQSGHGTVTIGSVEKFITENAWENKWVCLLYTSPSPRD